MKLFPVMMAVLLFSCTKQELSQDCANVLVVSYKYTADTVLIKQDTLYRAYLCDRWLDTMRSQRDHWAVMCEPSIHKLELIKTIIK